MGRGSQGLAPGSTASPPCPVLQLCATARLHLPAWPAHLCLHGLSIQPGSLQVQQARWSLGPACSVCT